MAKAKENKSKNKSKTKARANKSKNKSESRKAATCLLYAAGNGAGGCATEACEPRQVRKEASVSNHLCVPQIP